MTNERPGLDMEASLRESFRSHAASGPPVEFTLAELRRRAARPVRRPLSMLAAAAVVIAVTALAISTVAFRRTANFSTAPPTAVSPPDSGFVDPSICPNQARFDTTMTKADNGEMVIPRGRRDGIQAGMPVIGAGLVGRIGRVDETQSVVRLLDDPEIRVQVSIESIEFGILGTDGDGVWRVDLIDNRTAVERGDVVRTAGGPTSLFPDCIPVGFVRTVGRVPGSSLLEIEVTLLESPSTAERSVGVILYSPS